MSPSFDQKSALKSMIRNLSPSSSFAMIQENAKFSPKKAASSFGGSKVADNFGNATFRVGDTQQSKG